MVKKSASSNSSTVASFSDPVSETRGAEMRKLVLCKGLRLQLPLTELERVCQVLEENWFDTPQSLQGLDDKLTKELDINPNLVACIRETVVRGGSQSNKKAHALGCPISPRSCPSYSEARSQATYLERQQKARAQRQQELNERRVTQYFVEKVDEPWRSVQERSSSATIGDSRVRSVAGSERYARCIEMSSEVAPTVPNMEWGWSPRSFSMKELRHQHQHGTCTPVTPRSPQSFATPPSSKAKTPKSSSKASSGKKSSRSSKSSPRSPISPRGYPTRLIM